MKTFIRRFFLHRRIAVVNAHLNAIAHEREVLDLSEQHCIRAANRFHLELLNLDIEARYRA